MRILYILFVLSVLTQTFAQAAETPSYTTNNAFSLTLTDGSVLLCNPQISIVPLKTAYAEMSVPVERISVITNTPSTGESTVVMKNGDSIRGKCGLENITVISLLGKLSIPFTRILVVNSKHTPPRTFSDSPAKRNACINNLRMLDSAKEQWALASRKAAGANPVIIEINTYIRGNTTPICPAGGKYTYKTIGENPTCDCPGHALPGF